MSLLISTVSSGSTNRLAPLAEPPCTMPGIAAAVLGAHHQHVAAVAVGDDLLLQVLRRVASAQERRRAWSAASRFCLRSRSRMLASAGLALSATSPDGSILRRTSAISPLNDATVRPAAAGSETARRPIRDGAARLLDRFEVVGQAEQAQRLERAALDASASRIVLEVGRRAQRKARDDRPGSACPRSSPAARRPRAAASVSGCSSASRSRPVGVTARPVTTDTMRSNSRALSAPACMMKLRSKVRESDGQ